MNAREAIELELSNLRAASVAPGLAAVALALATQLDDAYNGTAAANVARELRQTMETLRDLAPVGETDDVVTNLNKEREKRRGA